MGPRVLVTGASGFVGQALVAHLRIGGAWVRAAVRQERHAIAAEEVVRLGSIDDDTDLNAATAGAEIVVHLAARTHVLHEAAADPVFEFRRVNVEGSERLAEAAARAGVRRLVFLSSVKVNGESTRQAPFCEEDVPRPADPYGISKWQAEQSLARIASRTGMEVVVLRAPLVYGPGVKANFLRLMDLVARGTPLPLAAVRNRRSLIYLGNLVDAIVACVEAPESAHKTYLVSDGEDISTPGLIRALAAALKVPARLFSLPAPALKLAGALLGKKDEIARLTGSLQVDSSRIRSELDWRPPFRLSEGLAATARWYRSLG
jgi:nucleoside-diphosphate-sugar epimerase